MTARQHAQFFHELAQLTRSGLPVRRSLEIIGRKTGSSPSTRARQVLAALESTGSLSEAFRAASFSESDVAVLEAGEATGKLEQVFDELEQYYAQVASARRQIVSKALYPLLVLHLSVFLLAIPRALLEGGWAAYWKSTLPALAGIYFLGLVLFLTTKFLGRLAAVSAPAARVILAIPIGGGFLANWSGWKFASVLSLYVRAGGGVLRAVESAGRTSGNALLRAASGHALRAVREQGVGLAEGFRGQSGLPDLLERAIEVGEHAGRLDEETARAAEIFRTRTLQSLDAIGFWVPRLLYIGIVLYVGWQILQTATGVASSVGEALDSATP